MEGTAKACGAITFEAEGLRDLERFCKKFEIPYNMRDRTVMGHKFKIVNRRAVTLKGVDIMKAYYQDKIKNTYKENRTKDFGTKLHTK